MWSVKATGTAPKVSEKIKAWNNPIDQNETAHFMVAQAFMAGLLANCAKDAGVTVAAEGFCAHDGRSSVTVKIDPIDLHV